MSKATKILPVVPNEKYFVRTDARRDINCTPMNEIYKNLGSYYELTTSYSLSNKQEPTYFSGKNSILYRISRWWNEKYVIIEQNYFEKLNILFNILLMVLTIVLILYATNYDLTLAPRSMIKDYNIVKYSDKDNLTDNEKNIINTENYIKTENLNNLNKYRKIQITSDIFKGISIVYIALLTGFRVFKRTTL